LAIIFAECIRIERRTPMLCPVCKTPLLLSERQGIEIDYCGQCRGIWLDRGELDKILERNAQEDKRPDLRVVEPQRKPYRDESRGHATSGHESKGYEQKGYDDYGRKRHDTPHRRKRSFLSDLLDFD
jgi:Zn-finger nucleic acid-binding protein